MKWTYNVSYQVVPSHHPATEGSVLLHLTHDALWVIGRAHQKDAAYTDEEKNRKKHN